MRAPTDAGAGEIQTPSAQYFAKVVARMPRTIKFLPLEGARRRALLLLAQITVVVWPKVFDGCNIMKMDDKSFNEFSLDSPGPG